MTTTSTMTGGPAAIRLSGDRVMAEAAKGHLDAEALTAAAAFRTIAGWTLAPAPRDPRAHVRAAHAEARPYLTRLTRHPADREVASVMTADLFRRLTRRPAAPGSDHATAPGPAPARYTYTPRKVLRRVLDHALDHLNQIDQWRAWRRDGVIPTPTDGWASSTMTLPEDRLPLADADLEAWLWRIDQAIRLLGGRADELTDDELDWAPPDGGWPLRRVVHHVARCEGLYARALDEAPSEDPLTRYEHAGRLLEARLQAARDCGDDPSAVYVNLYGVFYTPETTVREVLAVERELIEERRAEAGR
jgi:DinB family protein